MYNKKNFTTFLHTKKIDKVYYLLIALHISDYIERINNNNNKKE